MKKFAIPMLSLLLFAACTPAPTEDQNDSSSSAKMEDHSSDAMMDDSSEAMMESSSSDAMQKSSAEADANVIAVSAKNWEFSPNAITAKKGQKTILRVTGGEGTHSVQINDLGINVTVAPGETKDIEIPTDKAGTFSFRCGIPCGPGHKDMTGTIVIQ